MRVAFVSSYPTDSGGMLGGIRTFSYRLVGALREYSDLDIHVIHCHWDVDRDYVVRDGNLTVHYFARSRRRIVPNLITGLYRVAAALRDLRPDLVNAHTPHFALAGLKAGFPTVYTIHGVSHEALRVPRGLFDRLALMLEAYYDGRVVRDVSDIIAISNYVISQYRHRTKARFHRIDLPVSDDFFSVKNEEKPGRLLYAGCINEDKDIITLLKAFKIVANSNPRARLHVAGAATSPGYYKKTVDYIRENRLEDKVSLLGLLDVPRLLHEYAECALLVLSSRQENSPNVVIEAMASGKPVVATRGGGVPDLVDDGQTGFMVERGDFEALAEKIVQLLEDDALRQTMGEKGRLKASQRFKLEQVARAYRETYRTVLGADNAPEAKC
ncbi:MAG: glycosyltransferase family 4 protein [Dehalococcoidales bacterium]|nr:glycosyltransferase family 4 protein [Dehalococcoidales bacterium]